MNVKENKYQQINYISTIINKYSTSYREPGYLLPRIGSPHRIIVGQLDEGRNKYFGYQKDMFFSIHNQSC